MALQWQLPRSDKLALVDGDIGLASTAEKIVANAVERFGSVDALVNNAGIFFAKPFTQYTTQDFRALSSTNLDGFIYTTQLVVERMLSQGAGGSIVSITASIADRPPAPASAGQEIFSTDQTNEDGVHDVLAIFFTLPLRVLHQWRLHHCAHR